MIKWCSYCQKFLGEVEPLDNYSPTHGMCLSCKAKGFEKIESEMDSIKTMAALQKRLMDAGAKQDCVLAEQVMEEAKAAGIQGVDLLMGMITPILWEVGDLWEKGSITVADEHRFTAFFEVILREMEQRELGTPKPGEIFGDADILLANAPRNYHYLGIHALNLWLHAQKVHSILVRPGCTLETLLSDIRQFRPRFVGFSVALSEQMPATIKLCEEIHNELKTKTPTILLGGAAIKRGAPFSGKYATPMHDINELLGILRKGLYAG